jgi:hypothetical protein
VEPHDEDAIDRVTRSFDRLDEEKELTAEEQARLKFLASGQPAKERIEYWHEQLDVLAFDMGRKPLKEDASAWSEVMETVYALRAALRRLHGAWSTTQTFKKSIDKLRKGKDEKGSNENSEGESKDGEENRA